MCGASWGGHWIETGCSLLSLLIAIGCTGFDTPLVQDHCRHLWLQSVDCAALLVGKPIDFTV